RSFGRLRRFAKLARRVLFAHVSRFAVQEQQYAERLRLLGVPEAMLAVTGSIKFDAALKDRETPGTRALAKLLASGRREPAVPEPWEQPAHAGRSPVVWLAGSTHAPEESIVLAAFARLRD